MNIVRLSLIEVVKNQQLNLKSFYNINLRIINIQFAFIRDFIFPSKTNYFIEMIIFNLFCNEKHVSEFE